MFSTGLAIAKKTQEIEIRPPLGCFINVDRRITSSKSELGVSLCFLAHYLSVKTEETGFSYSNQQSYNYVAKFSSLITAFGPGFQVNIGKRATLKLSALLILYTRDVIKSTTMYKNGPSVNNNEVIAGIEYPPDWNEAFTGKIGITFHFP